MGEAFKARDERLARFVALKILHAPTATDAALRDRFQREARQMDFETLRGFAPYDELMKPKG
jgi:hypothetical protein